MNVTVRGPVVTREMFIALPKKIDAQSKQDVFAGLNQSAIRPLRQKLRGLCQSKLRRTDDGFTLTFTGPESVVEVVMFAVRRLSALVEKFVALATELAERLEAFTAEVAQMNAQFAMDIDRLEAGAPAESN